MDKNICDERTALEKVQIVEYWAPPVTVIAGNVVVGFDRDRLEGILGLSLLCHKITPALRNRDG